jgi:hypothetical protein
MHFQDSGVHPIGDHEVWPFGGINQTILLILLVIKMPSIMPEESYISALVVTKEKKLFRVTFFIFQTPLCSRMGAFLDRIKVKTDTSIIYNHE